MRHEPLPPHLEDLWRARSSGIRKELAEYWDGEDDRRKVVAPRLDLAQMMTALSSGKRLEGENREVIQERARLDGRSPDYLRPFIGFRDLSTAVGGQGGYFVESESTEAVDILRPFSVTARMGMQIETGLVGDRAVPKVSTKTTAGWLSTETSQITPSTPTLTQIALTPKQIGDVVQFTRLIERQANPTPFVGREVLRTIGSAIDVAGLNGPGANGQPTGILNTAGVQTQSGTTLSAGVTVMKQKSAEANVNDESIRFLSTPAVRQLLENRERVTGSGRFVWEHEEVADRGAFVSTDVPTGTMLCGDFSLVYLGIWGAGFTLEINPYDPVGFKAGLIQARIIVSCDIAVLHPNGFVVASSIT